MAMKALKFEGNGLILNLYTEEDEIRSKSHLLNATAWRMAELLENEPEKDRWTIFKQWRDNLAKVGVMTFRSKKELEDATQLTILEILEEMDNQGWINFLLDNPGYPLKPQPLEDGENPDEQTAEEMMLEMTPHNEDWM